EQLVRDGQAEHPGGLVIDDQLELGRLHHRQVRRLRTLENATGIDADDTPRICDVGSVAHQPAGFGDFTRGGSHGNRVARRHGAQLNPSAVEKSVRADEEGIDPLAHKGCKCGIDLAAAGSVEDLDLQPEGASSRLDLFLRALASNVGWAGLTSTATRVALGTSSRSSSSRFATNSELKKLIPVRFPPGRA